MTNNNGQNGQYDWNPGTEQWAAPTQQYQQPQYAQPQYAQPYPGGYPPQQPQQPQNNGGRNNGWLIAVAALLLAALVGLLAYLFGSGAFSGTSEPVTVTDVETQTLQPQQQQQQQPAQQAPAPAPAQPSRRTYSNYAPDTSVTSSGFSANVYSAFVDAYNSTGSTDVTVRAYSPATGQTYRMSCSGGSTVYCSGGDNARVRIW